MFTQPQADLIQEEARRAAAKEEIHWDPMIFHGLLYKYSFARCNSIYIHIYIHIYALIHILITVYIYIYTYVHIILIYVYITCQYTMMGQRNPPLFHKECVSLHHIISNYFHARIIKYHKSLYFHVFPYDQLVKSTHCWGGPVVFQIFAKSRCQVLAR